MDFFRIDLSWISFSNPVGIWWCFLAVVSTVNIGLWFWTYNRLKNRFSVDPHLKGMVFLSAGYVFGCAFRSFLPRADVQRICLFDTWFSTVLVGRSVATVAELCFAFQWALALKYISKGHGSKFAETISHAIVPLIFVAECFSWYAVITTNYFGNTVEESLWTVTYSLMCASLILFWAQARGKFAWGFALVALGTFLYVLFMSTVDVPMYFHRWQEDTAQGKVYFSFLEGINDLNTKWNVTREPAMWAGELAWMALYFSGAVWASLAFCYVPFKRYRVPFGNHTAQPKGTRYL